VSPLLLRAVVMGVGGWGLEVGDEMTFVAAGRIGVWASQLEGRAELGRAEMLEHHRLVEAICAAGACLPARLGSWVESDEEARGLLRAREEALLAALARVEGKVELAVSCLWREGTLSERAAPVGPLANAALNPQHHPLRGYPTLNPSEGEGTRYLLRRRLEIEAREARERRARELGDSVERAAGVAGEDAQHRVCPSEAVAVSSALLVAREGADQAVARLRELGDRVADVEVVVNGPWPPYSFAGIA